MTLYYPPTQNGLQKTLGAALDTGFTSSATLNNITGIQNMKGMFVVNRIDTSGNEKDAADREFISFDGTSGSTVTTLTRGLAGSTDQDHALGSVVEFIPDVVWAQGIADALDNAFTAAGALDTTKVVDLTTAQTLTNKTLTAPTVTSPTTTGTDTGVETLTNKTITKRVTTIVSNATPTIDTDDCDVVTITALATAITTMTTNLSGTPTNFQTLIFRIQDDGTGRAITWGASFQAMGVDLPTTTTASKVLTVGFIYDTVDSKWGCVASAEEA